MASKFNWKKYETALLNGLESSIFDVMQQYPDENFYGAAFHSFYREHGDLIGLPCLAVNTEEEIAQEPDLRWSSPDWFWDDLEYETDDLVILQDLLNENANSEDDKHWEMLHDQWMDALTRVAKRLTAKLKKKKQATRDFGFFLFDEESDGMVDVLRRCMTPAKFKKLFPDLLDQVERERAKAKLPVSKKLALYASDLSEENVKLLLTHGAKAVPALINALDGDDGWYAAQLLGLLGVRDRAAIDALKKCVAKPTAGSQSSHAASALGILGETDFLLTLAMNAKTRNLAIDAIRRTYSDFLTDHSVIDVPLDYRPLEQLLAIDSCRKPAQRPRSSDYFSFALESREIKADDLAEAIRGTKSKYKMIREHAVGCLGDRSLGKACSQEAMQAIVDCFGDRAVSVRRVAAINIQYWKKMAKDHLPAIRKLARKDPDPDVRDSARNSIYWMQDL